MQTKLGAHTFIGVLTMLTLVLTATSVARADEERVVWGDRLNPFGLHSARSDGNDPRLLEDGTAWDPRISRDGQWIVYCTEQGVMRVQSDGNSNPELLVSVQRPYSPVLSPDGNLLAYLGTAPMLVDLRTGEQWTMDHRIFTHYLDFSPDGKWVLQVSGGLSSSDQIFVVAPQRGAPLRLLAAFGNRAAAYARFLSASEILVMVHNYDTGRFVVKIDLAGNMTSLP